MKEVVVKFDKEASNEFENLQELVTQGKKAKKKPTYEQLLTSINTTIRNIKANPFFGDLVPRKYLSKATIERYGTDKILRVSLVGYWRLIYTIIGDEVNIIAFILEFIDHETYNKRFGYKNK